MAYYHTRSAMAMVDVSLIYSGLMVKAERPLRNSSVSVWIESELGHCFSGQNAMLSTCT